MREANNQQGLTGRTEASESKSSTIPSPRPHLILRAYFSASPSLARRYSKTLRSLVLCSTRKPNWISSMW